MSPMSLRQMQLRQTLEDYAPHHACRVPHFHSGKSRQLVITIALRPATNVTVERVVVTQATLTSPSSREATP